MYITIICIRTISFLKEIQTWVHIVIAYKVAYLNESFVDKELLSTFLHRFLNAIMEINIQMLLEFVWETCGAYGSASSVYEEFL